MLRWDITFKSYPGETAIMAFQTGFQGGVQFDNPSCTLGTGEYQAYHVTITPTGPAESYFYIVGVG